MKNFQKVLISVLVFTMFLGGVTPTFAKASEELEIVIDLTELGFSDVYLDIPEYYSENIDSEYLEKNIVFISEYEFLELQDDKVILEEVVLDDDHVFVLYEYENTDGYIEIGARVVFTKVAIATFAAFKNPAVITRLNSVVASANMRAMTDSRAGAIRSAIRNQTFGSNQALQDTVMRRMVSSGMTSAQARAIGHGVSQLVRWR